MQIWTILIGQFVHPVEGGGDGIKGVDGGREGEGIGMFFITLVPIVL